MRKGMVPDLCAGSMPLLGPESGAVNEAECRHFVRLL